MRAAARILVMLIGGGLLSAVPATGQVREGVKRSGPVPYVELYGRKTVRKPAKPKPRPSRIAAESPQAPVNRSPIKQNASEPSRPPIPLATPLRPKAAPVIASAVQQAATQAAARGPGAPVLVGVGRDGQVSVTAGGPPIDAVVLGAFIDGAVAQAQASDHAAGVVVAVVQNGQVLVEKGYGEAAPGRVMDPRATLVRLGSVSKVLTWIAALKAVEAGRLKLDAPVDTVLPPSLRPPAESWKAPVTLRLLMEHAAGSRRGSSAASICSSPTAARLSTRRCGGTGPVGCARRENSPATPATTRR